MRIEGVDRLPVLSALRGFSAPVVLTTDAPPQDAYVLLSSRHRPLQPLGGGAGPRPGLDSRPRRRPRPTRSARSGSPRPWAARWTTSPRRTPSRPCCWPCRRSPISAMARMPADPQAIHEAREALRLRLAVHLAERLRGASRRAAGGGGVLGLGRGRRTPGAAQRRSRSAGRRSRRPERRAGARALRRRREHDRRHRRPRRSDADRRRGGAGRPRRLPRALEVGAAGDRQMVRDPGARSVGRRPRPGARPDRPSRLRRADAEPHARASSAPSPPAIRRGSTIRAAPAIASSPTRS